jgi:DNA-binding MarR family transcriptional regulator
MEELLKEITYEGLTPKELLEKTKTSRTTLSRNLKQMVEEGLIIKDGTTYKKLRETPSAGSIYDSMCLYHRQKLQDFQYRRKPRVTQLDITLQWYIESPNTIKGKMEEYNEEQLLNNIHNAYKMLKREFGVIE